MKKWIRKGFSLFLALVMVFSLGSGISVNASGDSTDLADFLTDAVIDAKQAMGQLVSRAAMKKRRKYPSSTGSLDPLPGRSNDCTWL